MAEASFSPRPPEFFEYLLRCPGMRTRLYGVQNKLGPKGHFAIGILRGQARVAGVWLRDPDRETWQAAFSLAQQAARRAGACEIVAAGTEGPSERLAIESGLHIVEHVPVFLLNKKGKLAVPPDFQYQLSDYDGLVYGSGKRFLLDLKHLRQSFKRSGAFEFLEIDFPPELLADQCEQGHLGNRIPFAHILRACGGILARIQLREGQRKTTL